MPDYLTTPHSDRLLVQDRELYTVQADMYDLIYFEYQKYTRELDFVLTYSSLQPSGSRVLDVACGTGSHALLLSQRGYDVVGLDLSEAMLQQARRKCPNLTFLLGDMRTFRSQMQFDIIMCMFGAINYLENGAHLTQALANFYHHLKPGGVVVIDTRWSQNLPNDAWMERRDQAVILKRWVKQQGRDGSDLYLISLIDPSRKRFFTEVHNLFLQDPFAMSEALRDVGFESVELFEKYDLTRPFLSTTSEHEATIVGRKLI